MPTLEAFTSARRVHRSMLAAGEKKLLIWTAERMPRWINSDHLTALGFLALPGVAAAYWWARSSRLGFTLATALFIVNWFGDSLDGTLARVRNCQRPRYGFYIDHVLDTCGSMCVFGGLALSGYMSLTVAAGLLVAYYILSIEVYLATYTIGTFHMSFGGFGPTELRILLSIGNVALYFHSGVPLVHVLERDYRLFDVGGAIAMAGMLLMAIAATARHTAQLYRAEPLP